MPPDSASRIPGVRPTFTFGAFFGESGVFQDAHSGFSDFASAQLLRGGVPYMIEADFRLNPARHIIFPLVAAPRTMAFRRVGRFAHSPSIYSYVEMQP